MISNIHIVNIVIISGETLTSLVSFEVFSMIVNFEVELGSTSNFNMSLEYIEYKFTIVKKHSYIHYFLSSLERRFNIDRLTLYFHQIIFK